MKWIDASKKLPEEHTRVLAFGTDGEQWIMEYSIYAGWRCPMEGWGADVTHWMLLPDAPNFENTKP
jgi:hypothetical protein